MTTPLANMCFLPYQQKSQDAVPVSAEEGAEEGATGGVEAGAEERARRCKDKWGLSWQITPRVLMEAISNPDKQAAKRAFAAMMEMGKIDIATIEAALSKKAA